MADNSNGAAIIEEELIHEIYASLLEGTSCRKCVALPLSARMTPASATSDAIVLASVSNNDPPVGWLMHKKRILNQLIFVVLFQKY